MPSSSNIVDMSVRMNRWTILLCDCCSVILWCPHYFLPLEWRSYIRYSIPSEQTVPSIDIWLCFSTWREESSLRGPLQSPVWHPLRLLFFVFFFYFYFPSFPFPSPSFLFTRITRLVGKSSSEVREWMGKAILSRLFTSLVSFFVSWAIGRSESVFQVIKSRCISNGPLKSVCIFSSISSFSILYSLSLPLHYSIRSSTDQWPLFLLRSSSTFSALLPHLWVGFFFPVFPLRIFSLMIAEQAHVFVERRVSRCWYVQWIIIKPNFFDTLF